MAKRGTPPGRMAALEETVSEHEKRLDELEDWQQVASKIQDLDSKRIGLLEERTRLTDALNARRRKSSSVRKKIQRAAD